jgi:hypothetical protein
MHGSDPIFGRSGFFHLTDVRAKRENSVPTCKNRNLRSVFQLNGSPAKIVMDSWAVIAVVPDV